MLIKLATVLIAAIYLSMSDDFENGVRQRSMSQEEQRIEYTENVLRQPNLETEYRLQYAALQQRENFLNSASFLFFFSAMAGASLYGYFTENHALGYLPWLAMIASYRDDLGINATFALSMIWMMSLHGTLTEDPASTYIPLLFGFFIMGRLVFRKLPRFIYEIPF